MGTNYYAVRNRASVEEPIHIGKSSAGWFFNFQSRNDTWRDPPVVWNTVEQVKDWLQRYTVDSSEYVIINEYDEVVSFEDFFEMVEDKQNDPFNQENPDNFRYSRNVNGYRFSDGDFS